mmetsp:Transcript_53701/g.129329  ORF Transcript_53701/g.129329 Transcript_53701/m.129329 type:complete len:223 (+) Transcript_53701:294-962(+)
MHLRQHALQTQSAWPSASRRESAVPRRMAPCWAAVTVHKSSPRPRLLPQPARSARAFLRACPWASARALVVPPPMGRCWDAATPMWSRTQRQCSQSQRASARGLTHVSLPTSLRVSAARQSLASRSTAAVTPLPPRQVCHQRPGMCQLRQVWTRRRSRLPLMKTLPTSYLHRIIIRLRLFRWKCHPRLRRQNLLAGSQGWRQSASSTAGSVSACTTRLARPA